MVEAGVKSGLSQAKFAELMGVSVRTLQDWEQGRREPSGAAKSLIWIAQERPDVLVQLFAKLPLRHSFSAWQLLARQHRSTDKRRARGLAASLPVRCPRRRVLTDPAGARVRPAVS